MNDAEDEETGSAPRYRTAFLGRCAWLSLLWCAFFLAACIPDLGAAPGVDASVPEDDASIPDDTGPGVDADAQPGDAQTDGGDLLGEGERIFLVEAGGMGCDACHGATGGGDLGIGPNVRGKTFDEVKLAIRDISEMEDIRLSDAEIEAVVVYLQYLADTYE